MTWDATTAATRAPAASPAEITLAMQASESMVAGYLERDFIYKSYTDEVALSSNRGIVFTSGYPIDPGFPVNANGAPFTGTINYSTGEIFLDTASSFFGSNVNRINLVYTAGFNPLPADLELALWAIFDEQVELIVGAGAQAGNIESITVPDVGTVRFGKASQNDSRTGDGVDQFHPSLALILNKYRRVIC